MDCSLISSVAFIPTAGALKKVYWKYGNRAPFWLTWPLLKGYMVNLKRKNRLRVRLIGELKSETISRLDGALELSRETSIDAFFLSGGKTGQRPLEKDSVAMMRNYLIARGIESERIVLDRDTLQTTDKINMFVMYMERLDARIITVWVVTSWYHLPRVLYLLRKAIAKSTVLSQKKILIRWKKVFPPITRQCFENEYAYNLAVEIPEYLTTNSELIQRWWRKRETKLRNIKE